MNKEWARERLKKYLQAVKVYQDRVNGPGFDQAIYENVMRQEPAAKAIMRRVNPEFKDYSFIHSAHMRALTLTIHTLALIDEAEEIERNLQTEAPQLDAGAFHPWIWDAARSLWSTGHYREAVQAAATSINAHLQEAASRRDISDYKLITEIFSENTAEAGKPRLRWPGEPSDETYKSMQMGLRSFGSGIFQAIRNQSTHDLEELTEQEALERLASMSLFCHWVDQCHWDRA